MKSTKLAKLNFMAFCCIIGLIAKKMINPFANIITDALHIPGGISTGFSIMFLVIAVELVEMKRSGSLMATAQGLLALMLGRVGSMGMFMPIGYILTGIVIDLVYGLQKYIIFTQTERMVFANALAAFVASLTANIIVFNFSGFVLMLYLCVSATSGTCYGFLGSYIATRLKSALYGRKGDVKYEIK